MLFQCQKEWNRVNPPPTVDKNGEATESQWFQRIAPNLAVLFHPCSTPVPPPPTVEQHWNSDRPIVAPIAGSSFRNSRRIQVPSKAGYCPAGGRAAWPWAVALGRVTLAWRGVWAWGVGWGVAWCGGCILKTKSTIHTFLAWRGAWP